MITKTVRLDSDNVKATFSRTDGDKVLMVLHLGDNGDTHIKMSHDEAFALSSELSRQGEDIRTEEWRKREAQVGPALTPMPISA